MDSNRSLSDVLADRLANADRRILGDRQRAQLGLPPLGKFQKFVRRIILRLDWRIGDSVPVKIKKALKWAGGLFLKLVMWVVGISAGVTALGALGASMPWLLMLALGNFGHPEFGFLACLPAGLLLGRFVPARGKSGA